MVWGAKTLNEVFFFFIFPIFFSLAFMMSCARGLNVGEEINLPVSSVRRQQTESEISDSSLSYTHTHTLLLRGSVEMHLSWTVIGGPGKKKK